MDRMLAAVSGGHGRAGQGSPVPRLDVAALVSSWVAGLTRSAYLPMTRGELCEFLTEAASRLAYAAAALFPIR